MRLTPAACTAVLASALVGAAATPAWATPTVAVRVTVRGAATETLTGRVPAPKVVIGHDAKHHVNGVHADLRLAGPHGGTAAVTIRLFKKGSGWEGWIQLSDPKANLNVRGNLHGAPVVHGDVVSWSGKGAVAAGRVTLTWTV
jgi:hypothetical protein